MVKEIQLAPIKETTEDYEQLEKVILDLLKREIYLPILKELGRPGTTLKNAAADRYPQPNLAVLDAIRSGRIVYHDGSFSGRFGSTVSKELKGLGAQWDRRTGTWKIPQSSLSIEVKAAISVAENTFLGKLKSIDRRLAKILPVELAGKLQVEGLFDRSLWKVDKDFQKTVKKITVAPELTPERRKVLAEEWQNNMQLWVKDFTEKEISKLRADIQKSVFAGNRYESSVKTIQKSFGVSSNKAKFLARQETSLLMAKFKKSRYTDAGVTEYKWGCVKMPHDKTPGEHVRGNVRYSHGKLEGKIFRWNDPPITSEPGQPVRRNNPQEDYNCRCFAIPIVRF